MDGTDTAYIDQAITAWLSEKESLSESAGTRHAYGQIVTKFRTRLQQQDRDLDLDLWADRSDRKAWRQSSAVLAAEIRDFASFSYDVPGQRVSRNTYLSRLIAISSFYEFAVGGGSFDEYLNPVKHVKRPRARMYAESRALPVARVAAAIQAIDRTTKAGARDLAFFAVAFETSRRASEVLSLHWKHVEIVGGLESVQTIEDVRLSLNFERCKGGKKMRHILSPIASCILLENLARSYEINPLYLDPSRPLWLSLSSNAKSVVPLTYSGARKMCQRRLGTSKIHVIRHTVAHECEAAGMPLREIQGLLGHDDLETTMKYLAALGKSGENSVVDTLDKKFGFTRGATMKTLLALPATTEM